MSELAAEYSYRSVLDLPKPSDHDNRFQYILGCVNVVYPIAALHPITLTIQTVREHPMREYAKIHN